MKVEKVNAREVFNDNNEGYLYGLMEVADVIGYCEWFKSKKEREITIKENKMIVVEDY